MKEGPRSIHRLAAPIKGLAQRFAFMALVLAAFALMLWGKVDVATIERGRTQVTDAVAPILDVISRPIDSIDLAINRANEIYAVHEENVRLREDRTRLLHWQAAARRLEAENKLLRSLLNFVPGVEASFITGRVIADTGGAFIHSVILNAGARAGVRKGQAAVTGDGLVGRVAGVGAGSARVLLITDLNSRIPVVVGPERTRAIMAGDNSERTKLIHLPSGVTVTEGDRVATSGHGGAFPVGLPVGVVMTVNDKGISVQPLVNRNRLEYVRVLDYGLRGIIQLPLQGTSAVEESEPTVSPGAGTGP